MVRLPKQLPCLQNEEARSDVSCSLIIASVRSQSQQTHYIRMYKHDGFLSQLAIHKLLTFCATKDAGTNLKVWGRHTSDAKRWEKFFCRAPPLFCL